MALLVRPGRVPVQHVRRRYTEPRLRELTEKFEIVFDMVQLIEAHVCFDGDTRAWVSKIGIITRNNGKSLSFGLPREVGHSI